MTDVLFGQAYFLRFDPKLWEAQQPYAPLGAMYAAACVRERGYDVAFFDAMLATSERDWSVALEHHRPRLAVICEDSFNYLSKMCLLRMRQAALTMIDAAVARGVPTIVSGSDASDHPSVYLERGARAVVRGEGEVTLGEALDVLADRSVRPLHEVAGLTFLNASGIPVRTSPREFVRDLDALPRPAWDLIDVERYRQIWMRRHGYFSMNAVTTRGCPYHCNWCAKPIYGQRYTVRGAGQVADEIAWLKATYRPDHVWFADDIFGLKPHWIDQYALAVRERRAIVPFKCLLRADQVKPAVAAQLRAAGCRTAWIGAESGSQRILDAMEKGTTVEQIAGATRMLHGAGIEVGFFLQFGYPGETRDDIERTIQMVRTCRPDDIGISVAYPLPGTPFYDRVREQLGAKRNWTDSDDLAVMFPATYTPAFYRALHPLVHGEFRATQARALAGRLWREPWRATPRALRRLVSCARAAAMLPALRRRVERLSSEAPATPRPTLLPVLSQQAAAVPSEQPQ